VENINEGVQAGKWNFSIMVSNKSLENGSESSSTRSSLALGNVIGLSGAKNGLLRKGVGPRLLDRYRRARMFAGKDGEHQTQLAG
jgi:hypothetical protein